MFQNDVNDKANNVQRLKELRYVCREIFKVQNIIIYILTFFISSISIRNEALPFGLAIIAACLGTEIPIAMVYLLSSISIIIFQGLNSFGTFFFISLIYFTLIVITKPKYATEERNEIIKTGGKLFFACFFVFLVNNIRGVFLLYDLFMGAIVSALTYCFYKIFVNGIVVLRDYGEKNAYTIEELIGAAIIIEIASCAFSGINIYGLNLSNIVVILLIMVLGWKNGMLLGGVAGISVGLATCLIGDTSIVQIAVYAVSGIIAGILNKFGKLGVIVGFILGNSILTYLYNGNIENIIYFREIFVASLGLLIVPSKLKIDLQEVIEHQNLISDKGEYRLEGEIEIKNKLNVVTEAINEITQKYKCIEDEIDCDKNREEYIELLEMNFDECRGNLFHEEICMNKDGINSDIFFVLINNENITIDNLLEILKIHNNYITVTNSKIEDDLNELIGVINKTYKMQKISNAKKEEKIKENKKIVNELKSVSDVLSNVSKETNINPEWKKLEKEIGIVLLKKNFEIQAVRYKVIANGKIIIDLKLKYSESLRKREKIVNISETISKIIGKKVVFQKDKKSLTNDIYIQTYSSEDKFSVQVGIAKITKDDSDFCGDSNLEVKLDDGKYLLAISDGMGTGIKARETSATTLKVLKNFLIAGFDKEKTIGLINSSLNLNVNEEMYTSLDLTILDLFEGNLYSIKNGCSKSYLKNKKNIKVINSEDLPLGIVENINTNTNVEVVKDGDILIMISDGVQDASNETSSDWLLDYLKNVSTNNVQKMADMILAEAIDNNYGIAKDDMTIIVAKINKKGK